MADQFSFLPERREVVCRRRNDVDLFLSLQIEIAERVHKRLHTPAECLVEVSAKRCGLPCGLVCPDAAIKQKPSDRGMTVVVWESTFRPWSRRGLSSHAFLVLPILQSGLVLFFPAPLSTERPCLTSHQLDFFAVF